MKRALLAAAIAFSAARCATIVNDTTEKIPVRSEPAGAVVSIECGSAPLYGGVTPTVITVPRAAKPCGITIAKEGYVEARVDFQRQLSRATAANRIAAAPVGILIAALGFMLTSDSNIIDPEAVGSAGYEIGTAVAAAPADMVDRKSGGAYKQVPGEVSVKLEPQADAEMTPPTTPAPPR
ncbi:MAG: hypothetical protein M3P29_11160 [Acidobacteriota bacterium]|nr:hypothetical protein [Acidobacteriota bacterium]